MFGHPETPQFNPTKAGLNIHCDIPIHESALEKLIYSMFCLKRGTVLNPTGPHQPIGQQAMT
jgi:hypothetical protein